MRYSTVINIILIPGYGCTYDYLMPLGNFLKEKGYKIHTPEGIAPNFHKISDCIKIIKEYIEKNNLSNVILIGHSKGGIIARYLLNEKELKNTIKKAITISSPHKGSLLAIYSRFNAHEMIPWSKTTRNINKQKDNLDKVLNIYGIHDRIVIPSSNLHLPGAKNIKTNIKGHSKTVASPEVWQIILKEISK